MAIRQLAKRRRALVAEHLQLVHRIARTVHRTLSAHAVAIDVGDLEGYGCEGLLFAAARFEFRRGSTFATFAGYRIRGAMYDALREARCDALRAGGMLLQIDHLFEHESLEDDGEPPEYAFECQSLEDGAEQLILDRDAFRRLHRALEMLPARERDFLRDVYFEDKLLMHAGAVRGLSKWSATRLHARAMKQLRQKLAEGL